MRILPAGHTENPPGFGRRAAFAKCVTSTNYRGTPPLPSNLVAAAGFVTGMNKVKYIGRALLMPRTVKITNSLASEREENTGKNTEGAEGAEECRLRKDLGTVWRQSVV